MCYIIIKLVLDNIIFYVSVIKVTVECINVYLIIRVSHCDDYVKWILN